MAYSSLSLQSSRVIYFILLEERIAEKKGKGSLFTKPQKNEFVTVLPGSLWYAYETDIAQHSANQALDLVAVELQNCILQMNSFSHVIRLTELEYNMLHAVATCRERAAMFQPDRRRQLDDACSLYQEIKAGGRLLTVDILDEDGRRYLKGDVKYAGSIPDLDGYWFAVELAMKYTGSLPKTDGIFDGLQLFSCLKDRTVLVAFNRIALPEESKGIAAKTASVLQPPKPPLEVGERVLWISAENSHELGTVQWIGILPDSVAQEYTVGVEFDKQIGKGTGTYKGHELFRAKSGYASLIPVSGLIKAVDFYGDNSLIPAAPVLRPGDSAKAKDDKSLPKSDEVRPAAAKPPASAGPRPIDAADTNNDANAAAAAAVGDTPLVVEVSASELQTDIDIGSLVEVNIPGSQLPHYGVVRWLGRVRDRDMPFVGVELEDETVAGTDGTFGRQRLFTCAAKHAVFVHLHRVCRDSRFKESPHLLDRMNSRAFGSIDCPDVRGSVAPCIYNDDHSVESVLGFNKGIQGHQNSCYMDAMLFSMFAYTMAFDSLLHRPPAIGDIPQYARVQEVLRDEIVNPLRSNPMFVRADKVMKLRRLLDECSSVQGLVGEEKDPEEFLSSLLQQTLQAEHLLKLSSGQECYFYQLFLEKDELISLPTVQNLLGISLYQADLKFAEVPSCLILQLPRFGKSFKLYKRIVPSLTLDITDFLLHGGQSCFNCGQIAVIECKDCFTDAAGGESFEKQFFCDDCFATYHKHPKRVWHKNHRKIELSPELLEFRSKVDGDGYVTEPTTLPREMMDLFAVVCIETSHYVAFAKCGNTPESPWVFFDSMADRIGQDHGYNVPKVELCPELPDFLSEIGLTKILKASKDKDLSDHMKRLLCDGYICMYESRTLRTYR